MFVRRHELFGIRTSTSCAARKWASRLNATARAPRHRRVSHGLRQIPGVRLGASVWNGRESPPSREMWLEDGSRFARGRRRPPPNAQLRSSDLSRHNMCGQAVPCPGNLVSRLPLKLTWCQVTSCHVTSQKLTFFNLTTVSRHDAQFTSRQVMA